MIFVGWVIGLLVGVVLSAAALVALSLPLPPALGPLAPFVNSIPLLVAIALVVLAYIGAYALATRSLAPLLPTTAFPLAAPVSTPTMASVLLGPALGELFARGMLLGLTASLNGIILLATPGAGIVLALWSVLIISLALIPPVALSVIYHGFLGWSAWLFPMSYLATGVGLLLFIVNAPAALALGGLGAFRIDFTTGVIETSGGLVALPIFSGSWAGFSLGNFNFLIAPAAQDVFVENGLSSHETGHSLNTAAFGGVVLWINAVDENLAPFARQNLAYGELSAESHAQGLPTITNPARFDFFLRVWG